jgi:hypothetical protein
MSIFSKFFFTIFGSSILAWLRDFVSRVTGDGGTLSDQGHTKEVYNNTIGNDLTLIQSCDSDKATVLYSVYVAKHPYYSAYVDRIDTDSGTHVRLSPLYNFADSLFDNNLEDDALLWLSASAGKATVLYRHKAFTDVNTHETRVTNDGGTVASVGNNARVAQNLLSDSLYFSASVIVPCASGKATVLYSLIPN